jgi:ribosomal-protein-alanine N-acetyltransferase
MGDAGSRPQDMPSGSLHPGLGSAQPLRVRSMTPADLDEVMRHEVEIYDFPWTRGNFSDSLVSGYDAWCFIDEADRLAGYSVLMWSPDEVHLLNLSVVRARQGRGQGEWSLRWIADDVHRRGATALLLEVRPSNTRAMQLYDRVGLQRIGVRRGYYPFFAGRREDAIVMRCSLPLPAPGTICPHGSRHGG